jgi:hypothetical protein
MLRGRVAIFLSCSEKFRSAVACQFVMSCQLAYRMRMSPGFRQDRRPGRLRELLVSVLGQNS